MMKSITALLFLLLSPFLLGQTGDSKHGLKIRFVAERAPEELGQIVLAVKEAKSAPFDLPVNHLSPPQTPADRTFAVWSVAKNVSLATIILPEKGDSFVVILIPSEKGGYTPIVLSANNQDFKAGDVYFYNHSDKAVMGYVGTAKFKLEPAKGTTLHPEGPSKEGPFYDVGLGFHDTDGDRALSMARWPIQQGIRMYVFFFVNPRSGRIDFRAVDEYVEADPAKP